MDKSNFSRISVISIWIGILIPISAALVPYAAKWLFPDSSLSYSVIGPIEIKRKTALQISIINDGKILEENLEISISRAGGEYDSDLSKSQKADLIQTESSTSIEVVYKKDKYILKAGNIRPNEEIVISVLTENAVIISYSPDHTIKVRSKQSIANYDGQSAFEEFIYQFGFWMFIILMILILILGIYQEYIMDPKAREKMLWDQLEKLQKK